MNGQLGNENAVISSACYECSRNYKSWFFIAHLAIGTYLLPPMVDMVDMSKNINL